MEKDLVLAVASYDSKDAAEVDLQALTGLATQHIMDDVSAALVVKDDKGKIHVHQETNAGKAVATVGVLGGAIIGALFPPAGLALLGGAVAGGVTLGVVGGVIGHFAGGMSRKDLKSLGDLLDEGEAAVIVVAESDKVDHVLGLLAGAVKVLSHPVNSDDVEQAREWLAAAVAEDSDGAVVEESVEVLAEAEPLSDAPSSDEPSQQ